MTASDLAGDLRRWMKPSRPHRRLLWAAAALATTLLAMVAWRVGKQGSNETDPTVTNSATAALKGKIDIRVWRNDDPACQDISVADAKVRPLRLGDRFSIRAELSRPAYLYVLDIDGQGQITPLYPWQPGKWHTLPADQKPVERISLPDGNRLGKIKPPGGLETLLLLARETPLTDDSELLALLPAMPPQAVGNRRAMFVLTNGQRDDVVDVTADVGGTRTYDISEADQIDAVLGSLHALYEHLSPQFSLVRTVTVVNQGE